MPQLPLAVSVELAHALVQTVAAKAGIRVLFIKGPTLAAQGIRAPRVSADVDVLVEPAGFDDLIEALRALAWHERVAIDSPSSPHSVTLVHDRWGCDIDVHRFFPGIFAAPGVAFELLWARRVPLPFALITVAVPDNVAHACIAALHALRHPDERRNVSELPSIISALGEIDPLHVVDLARRLKAVSTLRPVLNELAIEAGPGDITQAQQRAWVVRTGPDTTRTAGWIERIRSAPWQRKPREFWHAFWLTERELRIQWPELPPGRSALLRARLRRFANGLRSIPVLIKANAEGRRLHRQEHSA